MGSTDNLLVINIAQVNSKYAMIWWAKQ